MRILMTLLTGNKEKNFTGNFHCPCWSANLEVNEKRELEMHINDGGPIAQRE